MLHKNTSYHISFKDLRKAYIEVKSFLENESNTSVTSQRCKVSEDLGLRGDDNLEMLEKFVSNYRLNATGFIYDDHFLSEAELFGSSTALLQILLLPFYLIDLIMRIAGRKGNSLVPKLYRAEPRDPTFGDMVTWFIIGKYCLRSEVQFVLKK